MKAPFLAVLSRIHLPNRGSCDAAATRTTCDLFALTGAASSVVPSIPSNVSAACHEEESIPPDGSEMNCMELMNPGVGSECVEAGANDRKEGSMAHNRISPSQEPGSQRRSS